MFALANRFRFYLFYQFSRDIVRKLISVFLFDLKKDDCMCAEKHEECSRNQRRKIGLVQMPQATECYLVLYKT